MTVLKSLTVRASLFPSTGLGSTKRFILFLPQPSRIQLISKVINCVLWCRAVQQDNWDVILFLNSSLSSCVLLTEKQASAGNSGAPSLIALWCTLSCLRTNEWGLLVFQRQSLMELIVLFYMHVHFHLAEWRVSQRHSCSLCFLGIYSGVLQLKHSSYQKLECICLRWIYCQLGGSSFQSNICKLK